MQTFGSHLLIIRFVTHSLIVNFTEAAGVRLHHLMTLADSSLLSLTMIEWGNTEVSNNWVNKVCQFPLTLVWIISLQRSQMWWYDAWNIWLWSAATATWHEVLFFNLCVHPKMWRPRRHTVLSAHLYTPSLTLLCGMPFCYIHSILLMLKCKTVGNYWHC